MSFRHRVAAYLPLLGWGIRKWPTLKKQRSFRYVVRMPRGRPSLEVGQTEHTGRRPWAVSRKITLAIHILDSVAPVRYKKSKCSSLPWLNGEMRCMRRQ